MASTPTTKSQVQAYRFVLRRMESALVRKDAVMLHDPMRGHRRATVTGIVLAVVGLVGFLIFGVLKPDPVVPNGGIVIAQPSGQIYVVNANPHELIPVFNLTSAKLLLMAQGAQGGAAGASSGAAGSSAAGAGSDPMVVNDSQLSGIPVGRLTGIPDGPLVLPNPVSAAQVWAVCDEIPRNEAAPNPTAGAAPQTTVLGGQSDTGMELAQDQALLVSGPDSKTYLIYRLSGDINHPNDSAVRAQIAMSDPNVVYALGLRNVQPRRISAALINAIPLVGEITNPVAGINGQKGTISGLPVAVGQSFEVHPDSRTVHYYIALPNGIQQVSEAVAQIARYENSGGRSQIQEVRPDEISTLPIENQLPVTEYPNLVPNVIDADARPVMCLRWAADLSDPQKPIARTQVTVDSQVERPVDKATGRLMNRIQIGTPNANGQKIDYFLMNGAAGVTVHSAANANEFWTGPIDLVSARGVVYSIPDIDTAKGLGVANANGSPIDPASYGIYPAPESIVSLLPTSVEALSTQNVQRTFDTLPIPETAGQYTAMSTAAGNGGGS